MSKCSEFQGWVTETCKKCGKAFMYNDTKGVINDEPTRKFYCPDCAKMGFKNSKKEKLSPTEYIKVNEIKDKDIIKEFKKQVKLFNGKNLNYDNVLKKAIEVVGYKNNKKEG